MTAIALRQKGISCEVYERASSYDAEGAGLGLWANATRILESHGLFDSLRPHSSPLGEIITTTQRGAQLSHLHLQPLEQEFGHPSVVLLRKHLLAVLQSEVDPSLLHFGKTCIRAEQNEGHATAHFADGSSATADAVVFADGIHSLSRQMYKLPPLRYSGRISWRGVTSAEGLGRTPGIHHEVFGKGRRVGIFALPENQVYWYAAVNMPEASVQHLKATHGSLLPPFEGWASPVTELMQRTSEVRLILTRVLHVDGIRFMAKGRIALLGDAAHPMTPDLGQGACQAIEDAACLAHCLAEHGEVRSAFAAYDAARIERVRRIAKASRRLGDLRQMQSVPGVLLRNTMFRLLPEGLIRAQIARNVRWES